MWPNLRSNRARLASYLVHEGNVDVVETVETLAVGWAMTVDNGIARVAGGLSFEAALAGTVPAAAGPAETTALALHLLWLTFPPAVLAAFVQSKHMTPAHTSVFWTTLYSWVSWIVAAPATITAALHIGRPDLAGLVGALYTEWMCLCRSPATIAAQLDGLLAGCWEYTTHSHEWTVVRGWIERAGIICVPPTAAAAASISLNGVPCLTVSLRDRVLLALVQLFCTPLQWSLNPPPETAPTGFRALHTLLSTTAHHPSPIDELYPIEQYAQQTFA